MLTTRRYAADADARAFLGLLISSRRLLHAPMTSQFYLTGPTSLLLGRVLCMRSRIPAHENMSQPALWNPDWMADE